MIPEIDKITKELEKLQGRQDTVMQLSREVVKTAGLSITAMHAKDAKKTSALIKELETKVGKLRGVEKGFEYYSEQAHQEYVEAASLHAIMQTGKLPTLGALRESVVPYMLGVMDLVGELKREAFDALRYGRIKEAETHYERMQAIYDSTLHMRFANSLMQNFRKKQDVARIQIESTGGEILNYKK